MVAISPTLQLTVNLCGNLQLAAGLKDIARALGVSVATVSRALTDSPDVSAETKEKVWATAEAFNYLPNLMARSLRSRRSKVVGVIVENVSHEFGAQIVRGIHDQLVRSGYQMLLSSGGSGADDERTAVATLLERSVDGLIVADAVHHLAEAPAPELSNGRIPIVFINRRLGAPGAASYVEPDDIHGGYVATEHLVGHGHRRIAFIAGPPDWQPSWDRLHGYRRALTDYHLPYDASLVAWGDWTLESGYAATRELLERPEPPTAIFVANDVMAAGAIDATRGCGLTLPDDLALVGYDGREMSRYLRPPLTTVTKPTYELGRAASNILIDRIMKLGGSPTALAVRGRLIYRASCGTHSIEPEPLGEQDPFECRAPATQPCPPIEWLPSLSVITDAAGD
jgi:LacI family transcriptional regulator